MLGDRPGWGKVTEEPWKTEIEVGAIGEKSVSPRVAPGPAAAPGTLFDTQVLSLTLDLLNQELWELGSFVCTVEKKKKQPPGDSDANLSLRTAGRTARCIIRRGHASLHPGFFQCV